jgi:NADPH-dependent 2,4-dienoyl-CoA reductase/sulfur reductase-like enzyme
VKHVAIVGGSLAGVSAVEGLRERGFDGRITLIDAESGLPYDKPPLSKDALSDELTYDALPLHPDDWYDDHGVSLKLGTRVAGLDGPGKTLHTQDGKALEFDGLVLATGSVARDVPVPCAEPGRIHRLRTMDDSRRLRADLIPGRHLVVVGAGFIGLEVASTARQLGLDVTVVETAATPLNRTFGAQVGEWFRVLHESNGVEIRCAVALQGIEAGPHGFTLRFENGPTLAADVVLAGVGASPQTAWLAESGVTLANGVRCSSDLTTNLANIVAAGDVAHWYNPLFEESMRVEHWTNAIEQGRHAAASLLGDRDDYRPVPYFWTDQHGAKVRFVGRADAGDDIAIEEPKPQALVALFGRNGVLRGAVCVRTPRRLAEYREAINNRTPWEEVVGELSNAGSATVTPLAPGSRQA